MHIIPMRASHLPVINVTARRHLEIYACEPRRLIGVVPSFVQCTGRKEGSPLDLKGLGRTGRRQGYQYKAEVRKWNAICGTGHTIPDSSCPTLSICADMCCYEPSCNRLVGQSVGSRYPIERSGTTCRPCLVSSLLVLELDMPQSKLLAHDTRRWTAMI